MRRSITTFTLVAAVTCGGVASAQQATTTTTTSSGAAPAPATTTPSTTPVTTGAFVPSGASQGSLDLPAPETTSSPINRPLMVTGVVLLGGTYGASAIDAALSSRDADKNNLYYPIVGPWMDYANRGGCPVVGSCAGETGNKALLILDGIGQGLGAIGIITSLFVPEKATRNWYLIGSSGLHAAPSRVGTGYGLGAGGVF
jgi:hypothetical protein